MLDTSDYKNALVTVAPIYCTCLKLWMLEISDNKNALATVAHFYPSVPKFGCKKFQKIKCLSSNFSSVLLQEFEMFGCWQISENKNALATVVQFYCRSFETLVGRNFRN